MAKKGYTITQFEFFVYFLWVFLISTVLYLLLAARYTSFSGWLWFCLSQSMLVGLVVAFTILAPETSKSLNETSWVAVYLKSILLGSEALASVGLGILLERYHENSKLFDYYFLVIIILKTSLYVALGITRDPNSSTQVSSADKMVPISSNTPLPL